MANTKSCVGKKANDDIFALSGLVCFGGFAVWFLTRRAYHLVLRNEIVFLNAPAIFLAAGIAFTGLILWLVKKRVAWRSERLGWYLKEGGESHRFGGSLRWEDVTLFIIPGTILGTIGIALWLNCFLDTSVPRHHEVQVLQKQVRGVVAGSTRQGEHSFILVVADWKNPAKNVEISVDRSIYEDLVRGDRVTITTKKGLLGYEWFSPSHGIAKSSLLKSS